MEGTDRQTDKQTRIVISRQSAQFLGLCKNKEQRSAVPFIFCVAPRCPRGSLVPYQNEENQFHPVLKVARSKALQEFWMFSRPRQSQGLLWIFPIGGVALGRVFDRRGTPQGNRKVKSVKSRLHPN